MALIFFNMNYNWGITIHKSNIMSNEQLSSINELYTFYKSPGNTRVQNRPE